MLVETKSILSQKKSTVRKVKSRKKLDGLRETNPFNPPYRLSFSVWKLKRILSILLYFTFVRSMINELETE